MYNEGDVPDDQLKIYVEAGVAPLHAALDAHVSVLQIDAQLADPQDGAHNEAGSSAVPRAKVSIVTDSQLSAFLKMTGSSARSALWSIKQMLRRLARTGVHASDVNTALAVKAA